MGNTGTGIRLIDMSRTNSVVQCLFGDLVCQSIKFDSSISQDVFGDITLEEIPHLVCKCFLLNIFHPKVCRYSIGMISYSTVYSGVLNKCAYVIVHILKAAII